MKIILVHNRYISSAPSGEDMVYANEHLLLKNKGCKIVTYEQFNDDISNKLHASLNVVWSKKTYTDLKNIIKRENPDLIQFHNIWYRISPSAYYACAEAGIPVIQTLHNFRLFCVNGLLLHKRKVCIDCVGKFAWKGILRGCFRGSSLYSAPIAITQGIHQFLNTWNSKVSAYISLTNFARSQFIANGIHENKIFVKPNFLLNFPKPNFSYDDYIVFLGRISEEKGIFTLLEAWKLVQVAHRNIKLKIIGHGPLSTAIEYMIRTEKLSGIELLGRRSNEECIEILSKARFMVMPSIWYEMFPMTILEAFASGKAVVASRLGALAEIVDDRRTGLLFEPANSKDLAEKIKWMLNSQEACIEMGQNALIEFNEKYTVEKNFLMLMNIYQTAINRK